MLNPILRLTWAQTNDYFDIAVENSKFALWFVDQCNNFENMYVCNNTPSLQDKYLAELTNNIYEVNHYLKKINFPEILIPTDMYSQHALNSAHKNWISILRKESRIDRILYHISPELFKKFHNINLLIHNIEKNFKYRIEGKPGWRVENKFKNILPTYGVYNVSINYTDWGKSSWSKFVDGATEPNDFELSNWNTIGSDIVINLTNPYSLVFSPDYLDYCFQNQITPSVQSWPLGNLVDYNNTMPKARNIMNKNIQINNNILSFSIV
jgi:hypothetical protein